MIVIDKRWKGDTMQAILSDLATDAPPRVNPHISALSKSSEKRAARREQFRKLGHAISHFVTDPQCGVTNPNPWRVVKGATGFFGMQIDTKHGLMVQEAKE